MIGYNQTLNAGNFMTKEKNNQNWKIFQSFKNGPYIMYLLKNTDSKIIKRDNWHHF